MNNNCFLSQFKSPVVGLAPMDGVSDAPFRYIIKKYGNPDLIFTEFTHVRGICVAGDKLLHHFLYDESERNIIAQIYGNEPEYFYHATKIICALGFDGVDINMGCPAKNVASSGAGAGLIKTPELALQIIRSVKQAVVDWVSDGKITGVSDKTLKQFEKQKQEQLKKAILKYTNLENVSTISNGLFNLLYQAVERKPIPVSVKTRIGYDKPITEDWVKTLNSEKPEWISIHGRTLKQMYEGCADWDEIAKAVKISSVPIIANGDIKTSSDAIAILKKTQASGFLIGRASLGNPFIFYEINQTFNKNKIPLNYDTRDTKIKLKLIREHTKYYIETYPNPKLFSQMRKHYGWYSTGFEGANELRKNLMQVSSVAELEAVLKNFEDKFNTKLL